jgi:tetratricopeptide (TPR) repeat protein
VQSWRNLGSYFTDARTYADGTSAQMYRPLRNISYLLDFTVAGLRPAWWHAHNVALHAANACLVLWLLRILLPAGGIARGKSAAMACLLGALCWAAHPVHTEAIAWVKSRDELLFALFYLWGIGVFAGGLVRGAMSAGRIAAVCALLVPALLSKEMAVSFPIVLLLLHAGLGAPVLRWRTGLLAGLCAAECAAYVAVRHLVIGQTQQRGYLSGNLFHEMLTMVRAGARYVGLAVFPHGLLADYTAFGVTRSLLEPRFLAAAGIVSATVALAVVAWRRERLAGVGIAWLGVTLLPVSNVVPTMQFLAERFLYVPLFGVALAGTVIFFRAEAAAAMRAEGKASPIAYVPRAAAFGVVVALALGTLLRIPVWRNDLALHEATFRNSPRSGRVMLNYAVSLANHRRYPEALPLLKELAESGDPALAGASPIVVERAYGAALVASGNGPEGLGYLSRAFRRNPDDVETLLHLGLYHGRNGNHGEALRFYGRALTLVPGNKRARENCATALEHLGRGGDAVLLRSGALAPDRLTTTTP